MRCENYIDDKFYSRCWNRATKLAIIQQQQQEHKSPNHHQRIWICNVCFKVKLLNDKKFSDQLLQVTNLSKNRLDID